MKKSTVLMIAMTFMMTSCGTIAQLASSGNGQKFQDGIYSNAPEFMSKAEREEAKAETKALVKKTKESPAYAYDSNTETVVSKPVSEVPATINVTVIDNPYDWHNLVNPWSYYTPYSIGSSWWWSRHYDHWYWDLSYRHYGWYNPFRYGRWHYNLSWYNPWYHNSWYSPWYYNSWYSTWYYDSFWYNPWYFDSWYHGGWYHPYYCGWYGGWDPYWHYHRPGFPAYGPGHIGKPHRNHYYTPRHETEIKAPNTPTNRTTAVRRGTGTSSSTSRGTVGQSSSDRRPTTTTGSNRNENVSPSNRPAGSASGRQPAVSSDRQNNSVNYRRPSVSSGNSSSQNREAVSRGQSSGSDRGTTVPRSSSTYDRGSSGSYDRSYSAPSRSSSYGGGSGSYGGSSGSYSRGSSSSGGGYSRGGSSGGARR